jgi:leucyl aminopeptidase
MKVTFIAPSKLNKRASAAAAAHSALVMLAGSTKLDGAAKELDKATKGEISRAIDNSKFKGKAKQVLSVLLPKGMAFSHLFLIGAGDRQDAQSVETAFANAVGSFNSAGMKSVTALVEDEEQAAYAASGMVLRSYRFDKYFTRQGADKKPSLKNISVMTGDVAAAKKIFAHLGAVAEGVYFTRDFGNEPPNILYPESFADRVKATLAPLGVKVTILDDKQLAKLGAGSMLGVAQGSRRPARLVVLEWQGNPAEKSMPLAVCGKGVTFDTGGISIKPSGGMDSMKYDMLGAGTVAGLFYALAKRKAKVNAVGLLGLVENMPDGNAIRPGDILTSMSGQTIEVLNTDAEGRLVLADVMWYAQEKFKPTHMIDLATLTGAVLVALGQEYCGVMTNDKAFVRDVSTAGEKVGELCWELPLCDIFDEAINSKFADMQNIGTDRTAGSSMAGQFLARFVKKETKWVHMDIAGVADAKKPLGVHTENATGWGVRLLDRLVAEKFEKIT